MEIVFCIIISVSLQLLNLKCKDAAQVSENLHNRHVELISLHNAFLSRSVNSGFGVLIDVNRNSKSTIGCSVVDYLIFMSENAAKIQLKYSKYTWIHVLFKSGVRMY